MMTETSDNANQAKVITIGRAAGNTVVLDHSNVSSQHARITLTDDKIILEDLGSTNGTAIGSVENKISRSTIQLTDTIFFGSSPYNVTELLQKAGSAESSSLDSEKEQNRPLHRFSSPAIAVGAAVLVVALIFVTLNSSKQEDSSGDLDQAKTTESSGSLPDTSSVSQSSEVSPTSTDELFEKSLFFVVVSKPEESLAFRLGNCFAIDEQHLATTASIVMALKQFQSDGYREVFLFNPATSLKIPITSTKTHPRYDQARAEAQSAQNAYDEMIRQYSEQPPAEADLEKIENELIGLKTNALTAMEKQAIYDVAILSPGQPLEHWLTGAERTSSLRPNLKLIIKSLAFDAQDPYFDPQETMEVSSLQGRFQQLAKLSDDDPPRILARTAQIDTESSFAGSPVLTSDGSVVAMYSRPTPPVGDDLEANSGATFDAPLFQRIRECLE